VALCGRGGVCGCDLADLLLSFPQSYLSDLSLSLRLQYSRGANSLEYSHYDFMRAHSSLTPSSHARTPF
jgi:hypothetical protein